GRSTVSRTQPHHFRRESGEGRRSPRPAKNEGGQRVFPEAVARRRKGGGRCLWQRRIRRSGDHAGKHAGRSRAGGVHYKIWGGERSYLDRVGIEGDTGTEEKVNRRGILGGAGR